MDSIATGSSYWQPEATPDSYTLPDWIKILHNGAQVRPEHPRYAEVRTLMDHALQQVTMMHHQQNMADKMAAADNPYSPGPLQSALAGGAQGMSVGLGGALDDNFQAYLGQARHDYPKEAWAGNAVGGAIPTTVIAGITGAPAVATGITAGIQTGLETRSALKGAGTAAGTMLAAATIGKAAKFVGLDKVVGRALGAIAAKLGLGAAPAAEKGVAGLTIGELRDGLIKAGVKPEDVESAVQATLKEHVREQLVNKAAAQSADAAATRPQIRGTMGPLTPKAPDPLEQATYTRNAAQSAATPASKLADDLLELQGKLGRALTADEKEKVLAAKLPQVSPHDPQAAARSAYHLSEAAGDKDPRRAARRAAGTYSNWDPRQALAATPLLSAST